MSCCVHPEATGGEILTIGLFQHEGQSHADAYAQWTQLRRGEKCTCERSGFFVLKHVEFPNGLQISATYRVWPDGHASFIVEALTTAKDKDGKVYFPSLEMGMQEDTTSKDEALEEFEYLKEKFEKLTAEQIALEAH